MIIVNLVPQTSHMFFFTQLFYFIVICYKAGKTKQIEEWFGTGLVMFLLDYIVK